MSNTSDLNMAIYERDKAKEDRDRAEARLHLVAQLFAHVSGHAQVLVELIEQQGDHVNKYALADLKEALARKLPQA